MIIMSSKFFKIVEFIFFGGRGPKENMNEHYAVFLWTGTQTLKRGEQKFG